MCPSYLSWVPVKKHDFVRNINEPRLPSGGGIRKWMVYLNRQVPCVITMSSPVYSAIVEKTYITEINETSLLNFMVDILEDATVDTTNLIFISFTHHCHTAHVLVGPVEYTNDPLTGRQCVSAFTCCMGDPCDIPEQLNTYTADICPYT
jgi:hypothetical protein